ncbi:MAG: DUF4900 domain-containing protein, partial [Candidatus Eisenbacteria bacterium]|nr:DUF4900 domain-containing protein [Candidatus Eisenbacteria bacterium]
MHRYTVPAQKKARSAYGPSPALAGSSAETGASLIVVMAIMTAVLIVGAALFILGSAESDMVEYGVDDARAFYLAEGGLDRARTWLENNAVQDPPVYPSSGEFADQILGGGEYDVQIERLANPNPWSVEYDVVSTGEFDGIMRQVHAVLRHETFAQYLYFADHMDDIWFISGDSLDGRVHANGYMRLYGSPWFGRKVTSAQDHFIVWGENEAIFEAGYELGIPEIPLPVTGDLVAQLSSQAVSGGVHGGDLSGNSARYQVELGRNGNLGYLSYRKYERQGWWGYQWSGWTHVALDG